VEIPKRAILDSTVLINLLRGREEEKKLVEMLEERCVLSTTTINAFELYYGAYKSGIKKRISDVKALLSTILVIGFSERAAEKAGEIISELEKKGKPIDVRDLFIGSIASTEGFTLITHNKKHFKNIPKLDVASPSEILVARSS